MRKVTSFTRLPRGYRKPRASRRKRKAREGTWLEAFVSMRPVLLVIALATTLTIWNDPALFDPPEFMSTEPETIQLDFALCSSPGYARNCVTDGDTFRMGERRIRIVGIDTAERDAKCEAEARLARRATLALQEWLNRGAFTMSGRLGDTTDRFDRELRTVWREGANGQRDHLATFMRKEAGARRYMGGVRGGWC